MTSIKKISVVTFLTAVLFFAAFSLVNNASAEVTGGGGTGCSGCGTTDVPTSGGNPTGGDGGGTTVPAPTCNISTNVSVVNSGDQYTISWNGTPTSGTFKVNDYPVQAVGQKTYTFTAANYSRFVFTGQTAGGTCVSEVRVNRRVMEAPKCDAFTASPTSLPFGGGNTTLNWSTTNATNATIDGQAVAGSGSLVKNVTSNKTFTLNLSNSVGNASCTASVSVANPPTVPAPTCTLNANPTSVLSGGASTLSWTTTNASSVVINQGIGAVTGSSRVVNPTATTTYTMTVTNSAGATATCARTIVVTSIPTVPTPSCVLNADKTSIVSGGTAKLTWTSNNAVSGSINQAIGEIDPNNTTGYRNVSPLSNITYTMTVKNSAGATATCYRTITVTNPSSPLSCANNVNLSVSPSTINRGNSSTISWSTTGLTNVSFNNGVTATSLNGSYSVSPLTTTTYTMTATKGDDSINCPITINVDQPSGGGGGGGSSNPSCKVTISEKTINVGDRVTIKWDTSRATDILLKDNHGKTLIDTDDMSTSEKKDILDGEITIRPNSDTTYTLTASRGSRDRDCKVSVDVEDSIVVTQVRDQKPLVTGIALTQVPYTGFEAGPFLTSVFYTLLAAWALYMAYVLVGRRNGTLAGRFTPATVLADTVAKDSLFPETVTSAPVFYQAAATAAPVAATVGYAAHVDASTEIEAQAHAAKVLLSSDAIAYFIAATAGEDRTSILSGVLSAAKAAYPSEDGWVVVSVERMMELAAKY